MQSEWEILEAYMWGKNEMTLMRQSDGERFHVSFLSHALVASDQA